VMRGPEPGSRPLGDTASSVRRLPHAAKGTSAAAARAPAEVLWGHLVGAEASRAASHFVGGED